MKVYDSKKFNEKTTSNIEIAYITVKNKLFRVPIAGLLNLEHGNLYQPPHDTIYRCADGYI
jgi:hypothetical protein